MKCENCNQKCSKLYKDPELGNICADCKAEQDEYHSQQEFEAAEAKRHGG